MKLDQTGLILGSASSNGGNTNNLLIVPADLNHSIIWNRIAATNGFSRMPPLGTTELDPANIQLVAEWINGDLATRQSYAQWQIDLFGSTNHPDAAASADPDLDGRSNREEFLTYTDPEDPASYWTGWLDAANGAPALIHDLAHRAVTIEVSTNLNEWVFWNVPENNVLPIAANSSRVIPLDTNMPVGNFRFIVDDL